MELCDLIFQIKYFRYDRLVTLTPNPLIVMKIYEVQSWGFTSGFSLKVSQSVYSFTTSIFHDVENYFPRLWGTGISDVVYSKLEILRNADMRCCEHALK